MNRHAPQTDRRQDARSNVEIAARIRLPGGVFVPCTVRSVSGMGAGIELTYEAFVPRQFRLQIPDDLFEADCLLKHRHGTTVGLEFISSRAEALARYG